MKYCVDCIHHDMYAITHVCRLHRDLVTGKFLNCHWMRLKDGACGEEAEDFKPKPEAELS